MATGVLPVCLGEATRLVPFILEGDKTYEATLALGASTDSQDRTGKIIARSEVPPLCAADLEEALQRFRGEIDQVPPMFSAVRVEGRHLYELAREGREVEREKRRVTVHALELVEVLLPEVRLRIRCSKGTYVRTLAHDLGEALGCHAHLTALRRTESGGFTLSQAVRLEELARLSVDEVARRVLTENQALGFLPAIEVPAELVTRLKQGQRLPIAALKVEPAPDAERVRMVSQEGELLAVAEWKGGGLRYLRVLARAR